LRVLRRVRPQWRTFALGILAMVVFAATETALPALLKQLLDGSFVDKNPQLVHVMPLALVGLFWAFLFRTYRGFAMQVGGLAPQAARYAGFSARGALWTALLVSGGMAGLAGALEVAGPLGQLTPYVPAGYGFAAIIVAYVGRLHPVGIVFSGILMSMFYIGGELAQSRLGLPKSLTGVFQGLLLFTLLACDTLIHFRVRWMRAQPSTPPSPESGRGGHPGG
jgi:simple sugar transport system permease protein